MDFGGFFDAVRAPASQIFRGLYGAPADPRLSEQQNQRAFGQGLTQGGLAMMLAGGSGPPGSVRAPNDLLSLLAQGMMASQQGTQMGQAQALRAQYQSRMQELAQGDVTPENLGRMMMSAIGAGDVQSARTLSEVLKSMMAGGGSRMRPQYINRTENGQRYRIAVDPVTMEEIARTKIDFPVSAFRRYSDVPRDDGRYVDDTATFVRNEMTGEMERIYPNNPRARTDAEGRAEAFVPFLETSLPIIDQFEENPPPFGQEMYQNWIAGNVASDEMRQLYNAAIPVGEAWLRQTTGAAYNDTEYANSALIFIPRFGDSEAVRAQKRQMRLMLMAMTKRRAGLTLGPEERAILQQSNSQYRRYLNEVAWEYTNAIDSGASSEEAVERAQDAMGWRPGAGSDSSGPMNFDEWRRNRNGGDDGSGD